MKSLMIKDLSASKDLDRKAMSEVHGGFGDQANATTQTNLQLMDASVFVANNAAFGGGSANVQVESRPTQTASNYSFSLNEKFLELGFPLERK